MCQDGHEAPADSLTHISNQTSVLSVCLELVILISFSALTPLDGWHEGHSVCKKSLPAIHRGAVSEQMEEEAWEELTTFVLLDNRQTSWWSVMRIERRLRLPNAYDALDVVVLWAWKNGHYSGGDKMVVFRN